jgi:U3 small nucleolar RNA-associated protein 14
MKSPEQFDYLQREVIGPEWNTLTQFTSNVQPKVLTKAGQVIEPVTLPRHLVKTKK